MVEMLGEEDVVLAEESGGGSFGGWDLRDMDLSGQFKSDW
jgi:hypothetical protein